jgi:hypothetical protein
MSRSTRRRFLYTIWVEVRGEFFFSEITVQRIRGRTTKEALRNFPVTHEEYLISQLIVTNEARCSNAAAHLVVQVQYYF